MNPFFFTLLLSIFLLCFAASGSAHITPGVYQGKTPQGEVCQMLAVRQYFENNVPHPLNERIVLKAYDAEFTVGHPPVIDADKDTAFFNHDLFQGVLPTKTGAMGFVIEMVHQGAQEGPKAFHLIDHQWKSGQRRAIHCQGLHLLPPLSRF